MVISQGHVYWADLPHPTGSGPGFRRPVIVVQGDALNRSRLRTVVYVPLTSNLVWVDAPGNVLLPAKTTGLPGIQSPTPSLSRFHSDPRHSALVPSHLITLSARNSTDCGIVRLSACAVLRLITNSNFVGCSTGKSAGLAPFKILST